MFARNLCASVFNDVTRHRLSTCSLNRESYGLLSLIETNDIHRRKKICDHGGRLPTP